MRSLNRWNATAVGGAALLPLLLGSILLVTASGCGSGKGPGVAGGTGGGSATVASLMKSRKLSEADVIAALKTYTPSGVHDEFVMFASGGQCGNVIAIGLPSMRILKYVGVFTPEPWQGYGFDDETKALLQSASPPGKTLTWGDTHHPALSETKGDYDGQFLFINDKANARVAVIDLKDFTTQQIVHCPILRSNHGATFVTPNTEYVVEGAQFPAPLDGTYKPIDQYNDKYRGAVVFWKFDREKGRIDPKRTFALELPPYFQDLADAGKQVSEGWVFLNTFNTERSTGSGLDQSKPPLESGASQNDMDYLHVINWKKAEQVAASGKVQTIQGIRVIPLTTVIEEGLLHFVPEPKSPHGVDVAPDGESLCISGKLSTQETIYSFTKIKQLIDSKKYAGRDPYNVPILPFKEAIRGQVEVGLGPLHTQFDDKGHAYTSLFIESKIARWSLKDLKLIDKIPIHYNVGHLSVIGGDTVHPVGRYLVSMNKWAIDRFTDVGPLLPQNFQLIDISGDSMQLLYDMPLPLGEPHYAQTIRADLLKTWEAYTPVGINPLTHQRDPYAVDTEEKARVERSGDTVDIYMILVRSHISPDTIQVNQGDTVRFHVTNLEQTKDATHGLCLADYNINLSMEPGKSSNVSFKADRPGIFPFYCTEFCSALHMEMGGYLLVKPKETKSKEGPKPATELGTDQKPPTASTIRTEAESRDAMATR
ncbi:MAG: Sec-dependent nitrous-oxide reductase [Isosphaeraceae bacterium]